MAVLESLGCAYHLLAIHDALRADNTIEIEKVDRSSLYKARECFLILLDKLCLKRFSQSIQSM